MKHDTTTLCKKVVPLFVRAWWLTTLVNEDQNLGEAPRCNMPLCYFLLTSGCALAELDVRNIMKDKSALLCWLLNSAMKKERISQKTQREMYTITGRLFNLQLLDYVHVCTAWQLLRQRLLLAGFCGNCEGMLKMVMHEAELCRKWWNGCVFIDTCVRVWVVVPSTEVSKSYYVQAASSHAREEWSACVLLTIHD